MHIANNILKHSLQNVYFFVGTACGGKTTMAAALAKKHGFIHFNDNWHEDNFKVWESLCDERYQPKSVKRHGVTDWEAYFGRPVEEFLGERDDDESDEYLEFSIIELIKLSQHNKVMADVWIEDWSLVTEISEYNRTACLLTSADLLIRDYYGREDHREFYECIMSLTEPEKKLETQNELFRIGVKKAFEDAKKFGLFTVVRTDESTVEGTMKILEAHFGLQN